MDRKWLTNFAYGIHSNIPICCVLFFCNQWSNYYSYEDQLEVGWSQTPEEKKVNYIRCPECVRTNNVVRIHRCKPNMRECFSNKFNEVMYPPLTQFDIEILEQENNV